MRRLFATLALAIASLAVHTQPAAAIDEGAEREFVALTNSTRSSRGMATLRVDGELTAVARRWSAKMAAENRLSHNPNLGREVRHDWDKLGENVGTGDSPPQIHDAFMNSATHRQNILDGQFTHVGIGVERGADGRVWVTEIFMRPRGDGGGGGQDPPATAAPPPTTAATTAPRTPAPTTPATPTTARRRATPATTPSPATAAPTDTAPTTVPEVTTTTTVLQAAPLGPEPTRRLVLVLDGLAALDRGR